MSRVSLMSLLVLLTSCAEVEPYRLRVLSNNSSAPVIRNAVERIEILIDPAENNTFEPTDVEYYDGDTAEARITSAGEWLLKLSRDWIDDNWFENGSTFGVEVPLYHGDDVPPAPDPQMRIQFIRRPHSGDGEEIIAEFQRFLDWPLEEGGGLEVVVGCRPGYSLQCTNNDAPSM